MAKQQHKYRIGIADSWHQPKDEENKSESSSSDSTPEENINAIFNLNFDCLEHIISFLDLKDLQNLEQVSAAFKPITETVYKRHKIFNFKSVQKNGPVTLMEARSTLIQIGHYITTITIDEGDLASEGRRFLELVIRYCPNLENIIVDGFLLNDLLLKKMTNFFPKFKSIELISCYINDSIEKYLLTASSLKKLNLQRNYEVSGKCISKIKNLISLNLNNCRNVQPAFFTQFCLNNKTLVQLNMVRCERLISKSIIDITTNLLNLEELTISSFYQHLTSKDFLELINLPKLKKLHIQFNDSSNIDDLLRKFAKKDLLEYLDISRIPVTKKTIEAIVSFNKLEILKMNYKLDFDDEILSKIESKGNIRELYIAGCCSVTTEGLTNFVKKSPNLRLLDISGCYGITDEFYYNVSSFLKEQNRQQRLQVIVGGTQINEDELFPEILAEHLRWIQLKFSSNYESSQIDFDLYDTSDDSDDFGDDDYDDDEDDDDFDFDMFGPDHFALYDGELNFMENIRFNLLN